MPPNGEEVALLAAAADAPWLPGMAAGLARRKWDALGRRLDLRPSDYSTSRILARSATASRRIVAEITPPPAFGRTDSILLEDLGRVGAYDDVGLRLSELRDQDAIQAVRERLLRAFAVVAEVPSLAVAIGGVLSSIHVLETPSSDHDVSYSDPAVPFSVFVGVPDAAGPVASLRLAESLVHEAMHLQLTLVEAAVPLVAGDDERHWSPWQQTMRPTQGVLHGLYVFEVLDAFFAELSRHPGGDTRVAAHLQARREEIQAETADATSALLRSKELTFRGRSFIHALRRTENVAAPSTDRGGVQAARNAEVGTDPGRTSGNPRMLGPERTAKPH